jgi:hypothetical protein
MKSETDPDQQTPGATCPHCGPKQGMLRLERSIHSDGRTYERYFCPKCCSSMEVRGTTGQGAA